MSTQNTLSLDIPTTKLEEIATEACNKAFEGVSDYEHPKVREQNEVIVQHVLQGLLAAAPKNRYKFIVNSTIVQQDRQQGGRGMHSATGAYWDPNADGTWSWKMDGGEHHGFDVALSVVWVATGKGE